MYRCRCKHEVILQNAKRTVKRKMATFQEKILNLVERYGYTGLGKQVGHTPDRIHRWADTEKGAGEPDAATALCFARLCGRRDQSFWLAFAAERTNLTLLRESLEIEEG